MDERELNEFLWRSCFLGMRIALQALNTPDSFEKLDECIRLLGAIARHETTLHQPQYDLAGLDPQTNRLLIGIGNQAVIADRDLAPRIVAGLNRAVAVAERPVEALSLPADRPPLRVDEESVIRVGQRRISLDLIVEQYENGMTPEDMVLAYDTLALADVYSVISYYLRHRNQVRAYLERREEEAKALRARIETERPRVSRAELLARRSAREKDNAPLGQ